MVALYDEVKLKTMKEDFSCLAKEQWRITMEEEIESMKTNQV